MKPNHPDWLTSAVFYQIYPQSFFDTNGDGIGDIQGIIKKLDYIKSLGCNAVWINPCFASPFSDAGYDVADYYKIAPRYGTNADMKRLFAEAGKRGIRVCLDLVPGHTSVEHPWFKKSCEAKKNKYTNWYIWTNSVWDSGGGSVKTISGYAERDGNYVTNFFHFQPALNYGFARPDPQKPWQLPVEHPDVKAVREEMIKVMRFWLDMGASGFRVDMASSLVKEDNEHKATSAFWREVRAIFDRYYPDAVLISEWSYPAHAIPAGFHIDFMIHCGTPAYTSLFRKGKRQNDNVDNTDFSHSFFHREGKGDISEFMDIYLEHYRKTKNLGYISIPTGNHDLTRISVGRSRKEIELVFAFIMTMPGIPFIYYGDEIGMRYIKNLVSKEGGYCRTGSRTPMQWSSEANAGFSSAPKDMLYLPIDKNKKRPTVEAQEADASSLLNSLRRLIHLRKQTPALCADGDFIPLYAKHKKYPLVYIRTSGKKKVLVVLNPSQIPVSIKFKAPNINTPGELEMGYGVRLSSGKHELEISMEGISYGIFKI